VDRGVVEEEAVGQPLDRALFQKGEAALVQRPRDLRELALLQEPEAPRPRHHVEGEGTLGRGEGRRGVDPTSVELAMGVTSVTVLFPSRVQMS
jgi:hypothetical protein